MKTFFISVCCLLISSLTFAQTKDAPALPIDWTDTSTFVTKQSQFYLGYHWGGMPRKTINELLHINHFHDNWGFILNRDSNWNHIPNDGKIKAIVWQVIGNTSRHGPVKVNEMIMAIQHDPDAPVRDTLPWFGPGTVAVEPREGDTTGAIYGFAQRNAVYGSVPTSGANFNRYVLNKTGVPSGGAVVLNNPSLQTGFNYLDGPATDSIELRQPNGSEIRYAPVHRNGAQWYLSVNLRRNDIADTASNGDTILAIRIPFMRRDSSAPNGPGIILFDNIADTSLVADTLPFGRGIALKLRPTPNTADSTTFVITRAMLPPGNAAEPDITVSAFFRLKSPSDNTPANPRLQSFSDVKSWDQIPDTSIVRMGLEVRYFGKSDIAIDRFRFETPYAQMVLRSTLDTAHFGHWINHDIDTVRSYHDRGIRLLSFYGLDDIGGEPMFYMSQRHLARLLSGRYICYFYGLNHPSKTINPAHLWVPGVPRAGFSLVPYSFTGVGLDNTLGYSGWSPQRMAGFNTPYDSLTGSTYDITMHTYVTKTLYRDTTDYIARFGLLTDSSYKTLNIRADTSDPMSKIWFRYPDYLRKKAAEGPQPNFEWGIVNNYLYQQELLFGGRPWWTNIWIGSNWHGGRDGSGNLSVGCDLIRPQTGEEVRLQM